MRIDCLLHVHSSFSYDSRTDLADIARCAREQGYRCVLMSEHNNTLDQAQVDALVARCAELSDEDLLIIPGLELSFDENRVHLLAYGIRRYIASTGAGCTFGSLVDAVHAQGGVAVLAHPSHKSAGTRVSGADLRRLNGIEIWNVKNGNRFCPDPDELRILRELRGENPQVWGFGGLDLHHLVRFTRLAAEIEVEEVTEGAVLEGLRLGRFVTRGARVAIGADGRIGAVRVWIFGVGARALKRGRTLAYRWQAQLERRGFRTPRALAALGRKLF